MNAQTEQDALRSRENSMPQNESEERNAPLIDDATVGDWTDEEDEGVSDAQAPAPLSVEDKYARSQLRIVRTAMDFSLHTLRTALSDPNYINLSPEYQRRHRWNSKKKSQLIESFLMNIPVPSVFLFENDYNQYEVMDGRQRLGTISEFLGNKFALRGCEFWRELDGKRFTELPIVLQRGLLRRTISAVVLLAETQQPVGADDLDVRMVLFRRLNTGGVNLNFQELRNALYPSAFSEMLRRAARSQVFTKLWGIPPKAPDEEEAPSQELLRNWFYRTMADCELVLRYFAISETIRNDLRGSLRRILDNCMRRHRQDDDEAVRKLECSYLGALARLDTAFPENPFRLPANGRMSRPLYDALTVAVSLHDDIDLQARASDIKGRLQRALDDRKKYDVLIGRGNTVEAIRERVQLAEQILQG
jgi:hypothetical protein